MTVIGHKELLTLVDNAVRTDEEQPFDFNRIVPKPAVVDFLSASDLRSSSMEEHPNRNWYDWCLSMWGTKWNAYEFEEVFAGKYTFYTAWDPPIPVVRSLSWLFPEVEIAIKFYEPGMGLYGFNTYKAGEELD